MQRTFSHLESTYLKSVDDAVYIITIACFKLLVASRNCGQIWHILDPKLAASFPQHLNLCVPLYVCVCVWCWWAGFCATLCLRFSTLVWLKCVLSSFFFFSVISWSLHKTWFYENVRTKMSVTRDLCALNALASLFHVIQTAKNILIFDRIFRVDEIWYLVT